LIPDARKSLPVLRQEWENCTCCNLGEIRKQTGGAFVFGEGTPGTIMFIGEGPGVDENEQGRPFIGKSGRFLRDILAKIGIEHFYITNTVCCRSFVFEYDTEGQQKFVTRHGVSVPVEKDEAPGAAQRQACLSRLQQEIYIVDPILIVTLGGTAAETLLERKVVVTQESGDLKADTATTLGTVLRLPGAGHEAVLTPKGAWRHKVRGNYVMPTRQSTVVYPVIPLLHPAYVMRCLSDRSIGSPRDMFANGLKRVLRYYNEYMKIAFGESHSSDTATTDSMDLYVNEAEYDL